VVFVQTPDALKIPPLSVKLMFDTMVPSVKSAQLFAIAVPLTNLYEELT
jgi:hypothetical protein